MRRTQLWAGIATTGLAVVATSAACSTSKTIETTPHISALVTVRSIGPVVVRQDRQSVESELSEGKLISTVPAGDPRHRWKIERVSYHPAGLVVYYVTPVAGGAETVIEVETTSAYFRTRQGVGVGSSLSSVQALPGVLCSVDSCQVGFASNKLPGMGFFISAGKVTRVAVLASGH